MDLLTAPPRCDDATVSLESTAHQNQLLFREAKRRERRRRLRWLAMSLAGVAVVGALVGASYGAFGSSPSPTGAPSASVGAKLDAKVVTCQGTTIARPSTFVVTCADAYTQLTKTRWTSWNSTGAVGVTTFALNLCKPYCAASKMSYFPDSSVRFSAPVSTSRGKLFSLLVVHYKVDGATKTFRFSFRGDPSL